MPLNELASSRRIAGVNSVLRKLKADGVSKIFISKEADIPLAQNKINLDILERFDKAGLDFAFPTQTIYNIKQ